MNQRLFLSTLATGLLLAACASEKNYSGNSGNLDLPTAATSSTATPRTTTGTASSAANNTVSTMDNTVATADTAVTSTAATATSAANTATPPTLPTGTAPYTVVQGDSLWKIAHNHKTSVNTLKALNNMTSDMLHPGQTLLVPAK